MSTFRCPDPVHGDAVVPLKANNDRVYECPSLHKYWKREENGQVLLVNLITQDRHPAVACEGGEDPAGSDRPRLNFLVDVPFLQGQLDFNELSLTPQQWKLIARIDGKSNVEEVRLLAGLVPQEAEKVLNELIDAGIVEVRRRGGR